MSSDEWEQFILEWVDSLRVAYSEVHRCGGAGDMGRDIVGFKTPPGPSAPWDNYQCKHYASPLSISDVVAELGKLLYHVSKGEFTFPEAYVFISPRGPSTALLKCLQKGTLKQELVTRWDKTCRTTISTTGPIELASIKTTIEAYDFSTVTAAPPLKVIEGHQKTRYYAFRFGGGLPTRQLFVWSKAKSAKLLDSIVKGFPIGTFILWKTNERLRSIRNLGGVKLPETPKGDAVKYVLDGQQRLTSLFVTLKGLTINREDRQEDFSHFWVDLTVDEGDEIVLMETTDRDPKEIIQLKDLLSGDFAYLASFPTELQDKIRRYKNRIEAYLFSAILMNDAPIDVATEVFTRLNVGGEPLSVFEIMVAKTYDPDAKFDLAEQFESLITDLQSVDYDTLSPATILQTVSVLIRKDCRKKEILNLPKQEVIKTWPKAVEAIHASVDYFRNYYRIPVSRLLPYPGLIIPFAYFFFKHPDKPTGERQKYLQDFFWRVSLGGRYSQSLETRVAQDITKIDKILKGKLPTYDWAVDVTPGFIEKNGYFSTSRSFIKAILCILAHKEPKSFIDNSIVRLNNAYLKQANSKNYHHFFPKAWLAKQDEDWDRINHIANITLVDDFLNKRIIRAQSPKKYMKDFIEKNHDIDKCMATHLIKLNKEFGVMNDDYKTFFAARCKAISRELGKQIIPQDIDQIAAAKAGDETAVEEEEWLAS